MALTEVEILDQMRTQCRKAIEDAENLAKLPAQGPTYVRLREELKLIEGCCRQAAYWREDARWLPIGLKMEEAHQRARVWVTRHYARKMFLMLANNLRALERKIDNLQHHATGRRGTILPDVQAAPHRDTRPVGWTATPSGLVIPSDAAA